MTETPLVSTFAALGDETRWNILVRLSRCAASASKLAEEFPITRQGIQKHLEVLRAVGLVETRRHGREVRYVALGSRLRSVGRDLQSIAVSWDRRLASIKALAEADVDSDGENT